jgi:glycine/D-amino acid oxidase-like deaminating enzyme
MIYSSTPSSKAKQAVADVSHTPFWLDDPAKPNPEPPLTQNISTDLLIIGAGYTGLWTALLAKEEDPNRDILILEAGESAIGASGRNGGFMDASITHGFVNGQAQWSREIKTLHALGLNNLAEIETTLARLNIDCDYQRTGEIDLATEPYLLETFREIIELAKQYDIHFEFLDRDQIQRVVKSPIFLGGIKRFDSSIVNPAHLAWGLRQACLNLGVRLYEHSPVTQLIEEKNKVIARTSHAKITANKVALATNAFPPLIKEIKRYVVPVYDYALMTEPLTASQRDSIGWRGREGLSDGNNQFHYFRTTIDGRILWGGFDAV